MPITMPTYRFPFTSISIGLLIVPLLLFILPFGIVQAQDTFKGTIFLDHSGNGALDGQDYGHPVIRVNLYDDVNGDCLLDSGDNLLDQTTTDLDGNYSLSTLYAPDTIDYEKRLTNEPYDAEENISTGAVSLNDKMISLGERAGQSTLVGLKISSIGINRGVTITNAYLRFRAADNHTNPANLTIKGELTDYAVTFSTTTNDISNRTTTTASTNWVPGNWDNGKFYDSDDISAVIQEIIDQPQWEKDNPMAFIISGTGERSIFAEDSLHTSVVLYLSYVHPNASSHTVYVVNGSDDAEEDAAGANVGDVSTGSSDLELVNDGVDQIIGMRFRDIWIPTGKYVSNAYIEFQAKYTESTLTNLTIRGDSSINPLTFDTDTAYHISSRNTTSSSATWNISTTWNSDSYYQSPDLSAIMNEIRDMEGWQNGTNMGFIISGSGKRTVYSYNSSGTAPKLYYELSDLPKSGNNYLVELSTDDLLPSSTMTLPSGTNIQCLNQGLGASTNVDFGFHGENAVCYGVSNHDMPSILSIMNRASGIDAKIGNDIDYADIEAIALDLGGTSMFAFNGGQLVTLDLSTGQYSDLPNPVGSGDGVSGSTTFNDLDAMSYDPLTGKLWAAERKSGSSAWDLLIQVDPVTGLLVNDAFGTGNDYVLIKDNAEVIPRDIDDFAIDPSNGTLYGVANGGAGYIDILVQIDKNTGIATMIDTIKQSDGSYVGDMEGFGFTNFGLLIGVTGEGSVTMDNTQWVIDLNTAIATKVGTYSYGADYESCDCLASKENRIEGTAYEDANSNGIQDGGESGFENITVYLYIDQNNDGLVDGSDELVDSTLTASDGSYAFVTGSNIDFVLSIDTADLPPSSNIMTTDNHESALFDGNYGGLTDGSNDFGASSAPLPVELERFYGESIHCNTQVYWTSVSEQKFSHYDLEKSMDGSTFSKIKTIRSANSESGQTYQYTDEAAGTINYYRLKMVDLDGSYTYSETLVIKVDCKSIIDQKMLVYPNPIGKHDTKLQVKFESTEEAVNLIIFDARGKALQNLPLKVEKGWNYVRIDTSIFPSGTYFIAKHAEGKRQQIQKFIIQE